PSARMAMKTSATTSRSDQGIVRRFSSRARNESRAWLTACPTGPFAAIGALEESWLEVRVSLVMASLSGVERINRSPYYREAARFRPIGCCVSAQICVSARDATRATLDG